MRPLLTSGKEAKMLVLTRKTSESIILQLAEGIDPATPIGDILDKITITPVGVNGNQIKLGIDVLEGVRILREEIV